MSDPGACTNEENEKKKKVIALNPLLKKMNQVAVQMRKKMMKWLLLLGSSEGS